MTPFLTRLGEIRERLERATPGPWRLYGDKRDARDYEIYGRPKQPILICSFAHVGYSEANSWMGKENIENARLISQVPVDIAFLLSAVTEMREALEKLNKPLDITDGCEECSAIWTRGWHLKIPGETLERLNELAKAGK